MPDHLHWLIQLSDNYTLPYILKQLKAVSARHLNQYLNRTGAVWQKCYHDHALREEEDIKHISRYIVANPIRAGLTKRIGHYSHWDAVWL